MHEVASFHILGFLQRGGPPQNVIAMGRDEMIACFLTRRPNLQRQGPDFSGSAYRKLMKSSPANQLEQLFHLRPTP